MNNHSTPLDLWADAYSAFKGAFDTPVSHRKDNSDYAEDARKRMADFNEAMRATLQLSNTITVPDAKPLPDLMLASYHEAIGWNACREAMLASQSH